MTAPAPGQRRKGRRRAPALSLRWLFAYPVVLLGLAAGLGIVAVNRYRTGLLVVALAVLAGALVRLVLPGRGPAGWSLASRGRTVDVVVMTIMAVAIAVLTIALPEP